MKTRLIDACSLLRAVARLWQPPAPEADPATPGSTQVSSRHQRRKVTRAEREAFRKFASEYWNGK